MDVLYLIKKEMLRRGYSLRTINVYNYCINKFLKSCNKDIKKVNKSDIKEYLDKLVEKNKAGSSININLNALKFLFEQILNKKVTVKIKYSKLPKSLPIFLNKEEVVRLINSIKNEKHKLMIKLMYGAGLRVSELVKLKVNDLDLEENYGWVRHGKGNKDRMFIIAESLVNDLSDYIKMNNLSGDNWLFNSYNGNISVRSVQVITKRAAKKAGISKKVHPHTLRHSYATHLIENGYDVASVQSLLGHNSAETTMVYLHIAPKRFINVKSPLDSLDLGNSQSNNDNEKSSCDEDKNKVTRPVIQEYRDLRI